MRLARSFPMPGISRSDGSLRSSRWCGWFDAMSAPFLYARILNGLSPLSSSRSAISPRIRAMARLFNAETFEIDVEFQDSGAPAPQTLRDRPTGLRRAVAEQ